MPQGPQALTILGGTSTAAGNTTLVTPSAGYRLRIYYMAYNPESAATVSFRFGAAGNRFLMGNVPANAFIAKDLGLDRYIQGATDVVFIINSSAAVNVNWTVVYEEVLDGA